MRSGIRAAQDNRPVGRIRLAIEDTDPVDRDRTVVSDSRCGFVDAHGCLPFVTWEAFGERYCRKYSNSASS
jgi:hypothetical protein